MKSHTFCFPHKQSVVSLCPEVRGPCGPLLGERFCDAAPSLRSQTSSIGIPRDFGEMQILGSALHLLTQRLCR